MTGYDYEYIVADYLRSKGYTGVKVTQSSGDYGIDVLASKGGTKYAVQCKYYSNPVGIKAVQEAVAGKAHYDCNGAMVVTNSTFTEAAQTLAKDNGVLLIGNITGVSMRTGEKLKTLGKALLILLLLFYLFLLCIYIQYIVKHPSEVTAKDIIGLVIMLLVLATVIVAFILLKKIKPIKKIKGSIQYKQYLKRAAEIDKTTAEKIAEINKPHILTEAECSIDYEAVARGINATPEESEAIKQLALREKIPSASSIEMVTGMDFVKAKRVADLMNDYGYISNYQWTEKAHK